MIQSFSITGQKIKESLKKLTVEHEEIGDAIHKIRHLAEGYAIPDNVCNTFVVTYGKLKELEDDLHKHVHLENNILLLKAVQLQKYSRKIKTPQIGHKVDEKRAHSLQFFPF